MKNQAVLLLSFILLSSCAQKRYITEVISDKEVSISLIKTFNETYFNLNIPLEFHLDLNSEKLYSIGHYYIKGNKSMLKGDDYLFFDANTNKRFLLFDGFGAFNYPKKIYLYDRQLRLSKEEVLVLINKYNPTATIDELQTKNDTIKLISYKQYRNDNPKFLEDMRKIPDSLTFSIYKSGKKENILTSTKINW
ncbi:hypothetical protein WFZ85_12430 [Flavobacterium sp. j3]|uniref:Lipoprotein n=1 Tax=Flavobacterium aureirubrum TaxID=3133147 RepID=A0ABU9N7Z1_9FLAO